MTELEFLASIEAYYGRYTNRAIREAVLSYLGTVQEDLDELYLAVLKGFGTQFRSVPDVAVIEKARRELREAREQQDPVGVYRNGRRLGHMDGSRFIPDLSGLGPERIRKYVTQFSQYEGINGFQRFLADHCEAESPRPPTPPELALVRSQ